MPRCSAARNRESESRGTLRGSEARALLLCNVEGRTGRKVHPLNRQSPGKNSGAVREAFGQFQQPVAGRFLLPCGIVRLLGGTRRGRDDAVKEWQLKVAQREMKKNEPTTGEVNYKNIFKHISNKGFKGVLGMEHGNSVKGKEGEMKVIEAYRASDIS